MADDDYYKDGLIPMWIETDMYKNGQRLVAELDKRRDDRKLVYEATLNGHTGDAYLVKAGQTIRLEQRHPVVQVCDWMFIKPDLSDFQCYGNSAAFQGFYLQEGYQILSRIGRMEWLAICSRDETPDDWMPDGWGHHFWHWHCSPEWTEILYADNIPAGINTCHINFTQGLLRLPAIQAIEDEAERRRVVNDLANNHNFQTFQVCKHEDTTWEDWKNCIILLGGSPQLPEGTGVEFYVPEDVYVVISSCPGVDITIPAWDGESKSEPQHYPVYISVYDTGVTPPDQPIWKDWDGVFYNQVAQGGKDVSPRTAESYKEKPDSGPHGDEFLTYPD